MTYAYKCIVCHHKFETEQRITDEPLTECPECHNHALLREINGTGAFVLKGTGWAQDGYVSSVK